MAVFRDIPLLPRVQARFHARVHKRGPDDCWEWQGALNPEGYGFVAFTHDGQFYRVGAHQFALIDAGVERLGRPCALHSCDNPSCCNPCHLRWGTQRENVSDRTARDRHARGTDYANCKLNESQVLSIRADARRSALVAVEYGVSYQTIWAIRARRLWTHI